MSDMPEDQVGTVGTPGAVDVAEKLLAGALIVAPAAVGGVATWSIGVCLVLGMAAAIAASFAHPRRVPFPVWVALGLTCFVGLQLVPLPAALLGVLSPHALEVRALSMPAGVAVGLAPISLEPAGTTREFARLLGLCCTLFAASRVSSRPRVRSRLIHAAGMGAILELLIIAAHTSLGLDRIYGVFPYGARGGFAGSFTNSNHEAGWLTLAVAGAIGSALRSTDLVIRRAYWGVAAACSAVILASLSRSGLVGLTVTLALPLLLAPELFGLRPRTAALVAGGVLGVTAIGVGIVARLDATGRAGRLSALVRADHFLREEKVGVWRDLPRFFHDFSLVGAGRGAFESVFPAYRHYADNMTFTHVENAPLQALADLGLLVGSAVVVLFFLVLVSGLRQRPFDAASAAAFAGLMGIAAHDLGDFALDASASVGVYVAVFVGILHPAQDTVGGRAWLRRRVPLFIAPGLVALALVVAQHGDLRRDIAEVSALISKKQPLGETLAAATRRHPAEPWFPYLQGLEALRAHDPTTAIRALNRSLALQPDSPNTHLAIAETLLASGRRSQALFEARLAYKGSGYVDQVFTRFLYGGALRTEAELDEFIGGDREVMRRTAILLGSLHLDARAEPLARTLLAGEPGNADLIRLLGRVLLGQKKPKEALAVLEQLPAPMLASDAEVLLIRVRALDLLGMEPEANALLDQAGPAQAAPEVGFELAARALSVGDAQRALATLDRINREALAPERLAQLLRLRARALDGRHRVREAILDLAAAVRVDPSESNRLALGLAYERAGLHREAYFAYRDAVRSSPNPSADARALLARSERTLELGSSNNMRGATGAGGTQQEDDTPIFMRRTPAPGEAASTDDEEAGPPAEGDEAPAP